MLRRAVLLQEGPELVLDNSVEIREGLTENENYFFFSVIDVFLLTSVKAASKVTL